MATMRTMNGYGTTQLQVVAETDVTSTTTLGDALQALATQLSDQDYYMENVPLFLRAGGYFCILTYFPTTNNVLGYDFTMVGGTGTQHLYEYTLFVYKNITGCIVLQNRDGTLTDVTSTQASSAFQGKWQLLKYV